MPAEALLPSDLSNIMAIENASFAIPWTEDMYRTVFTDSYISGMKWVEQNEIQGYLIYGLFSPVLEVMNVVVSPNYRRQGVGRRMMTWVLGMARHRGCTEAFLEVKISNVSAIRLYESFGFSRISVRKGYYRDGEDALVMGVKL